MAQSAAVESGASVSQEELRLPRDAQGLPFARALTRRALHRWSYQGSVDDVVLVVSELLTNALLHGEGAPVLRLTVSSGWVRVEVSDESLTLPRLREPGPDGGWGMSSAPTGDPASKGGARWSGVSWCQSPARPHSGKARRTRRARARLGAVHAAPHENRADQQPAARRVVR
jgi:hypothetical protein